MANITAGLDIPKPCKIDRPVYDHIAHGWYANNSVVVGDCVPTYRNSGGGVVDKYLTDFTTAVRRSIGHLEQKIAEAEKLKEQLTMLIKP